MLSDPHKRDVYDVYGKEGLSAGMTLGTKLKGTGTAAWLVPCCSRCGCSMTFAATWIDRAGCSIDAASISGTMVITAATSRGFSNTAAPAAAARCSQNR